VANALAMVSAPLTIAAIVGLGVLLYRAPPASDEVSRRDRLALTLLAGMCALWLSAKVLSPQYLTWGLPLVLGVSGKRGRAVTIGLGATLFMTQLYLCGHYETVIAQSPLGIVSLDVRLALLIALTVVVVRGLARGAPAPQRGCASVPTHA